MDLRESSSVAFGAIIANKLRSFLTMLGIIIGVSALITVVAVGKGGERAVAERLQALGTNLLYVSPGSSRSGPVMTSAGSSVKLTRKDVEAVLEECEEIE
ncbi:ABC transporter permease, partial [candidate division KSB1 bacterium]|nr:ABC transporter permease [candidate division KSB1 bacterium]